MSKFSSIHTSPLGSWTAVTNFVILCGALIVILITSSVTLVNSLPAESSTVKIIEAGNLVKASTEKPIKHPNYVRLLKRTKNQNDTEEASSAIKEQPSTTKATTTTSTTTQKPNSRANNNEKIKSIIINSQAEQTERPRGLSALFSFLTRPRLSLNNDESGGNKTNRNDRQKAGIGSNGKPSTSKNSTSLLSTNSLLNPGSILASVMKAIQGVTITFENMVMSFVNLFSFNGSRGDSPLSRLFSGVASTSGSDSSGTSGSGFKITPSIDGSSSSGFKIRPTDQS